MKFTASKQSIFFYIVFLVTLLAALALRLPALAQRPMHTDEAVHAVKFGALLEEHAYRYDPFEFHGPTLIYSTLIPARLMGEKTLVDVNERTLRIVPVFYGLALIVLLLFFRNVLSAPAILFAALFTAVSPAFVFYSRYYIMEILLLFFTFAAMAAGHRFLKSGKSGWAMLAGASLGLMHATKETCLLAWVAMGSAAVLLLVFDKSRTADAMKTIKRRHLLIGLATGAAVSMLFFSSFFSNPHGVVDSIAAYKTYFDRGAGGFQAHIYPWHQYFKWLVANKSPGRPLWSEGIIFLLAAPGFVAVFSKNRADRSGIVFARFIALYTIILTLIYMLIPYKTPWSMLGFYHGFLIVAAIGAGEIFKRTKTIFARGAAAVVIAAALLHLGWQALQLNFKYEADPCNPYVYAHTDKDIFRLIDSVNRISNYWREGKDIYIEVVCPNDDYWPLPWYFRGYSRVGYFSRFDFNLPAGALIITTPALEADLLKKLYEIPPPGRRDMYIPQFERGVWLRPGVQLDLYVRKDVWDEWRRNSP